MKTHRYWAIGMLFFVALGCATQPTLAPTLPAPIIPTFPQLPATYTPTISPTVTLTPIPPTAAPTQPATLTNTPIPPTVANPTLTPPSSLMGLYAVVLVPYNDVLNVRQSPGADQPAVGTLPYNATGIALTGNTTTIGVEEWVEIYRPEGSLGWVNAHYLTEYVPTANFCGDNRVLTLLDNLTAALSTENGELYASLVSPVHGLNVYLYRFGNIANYTPDEAKWVFTSTYVMDWGKHPASGQDVKGAFRDIVLPNLLDVLLADYTKTCDQLPNVGIFAEHSWPYEYAAVNYYGLYRPGTPGVELDWRVWLAGIEYVDGQPYLFTLIHFEWEP